MHNTVYYFKHLYHIKFKTRYNQYLAKFIDVHILRTVANGVNTSVESIYLLRLIRIHAIKNIALLIRIRIHRLIENY